MQGPDRTTVDAALPDKDTDPNRHVRDYLAYYLGFETAPQYAVMLDGPWGIGKTFILKEILNRRFDDQHPYVYVSLYGLASTADIDRALAHAIFPMLDSTAAKVAGHAARLVASHFRLTTDLKIEDLVNKMSAAVYVFDDLERCKVPASEVLGYINTFVEHEGKKVIVVANEEAIDHESYRRVREKVIGKTLRVQSAFQEALTTFIGGLRDRAAADVLVKNRQLIGDLYDKSELHNLRILQQSLWDFERVFGAIGAAHRAHDEALRMVLALILALSFELKADRLTPVDLRGRFARRGRIYTKENAAQIAGLQKAGDRYDSYDLYDQVLDDATLDAILVQGIVDAVQIAASLDASSYFTKPGDEPEWKTIWWSAERSDVELEAALAMMEAKFAARAYTNVGEMIHVFAVRLSLVRNSLLKGTIEEAVAEAQAYLEDMYEQGKLQPGGPDYADIRSGYGGLGFMGEDTEEVQSLVRDVSAKRQKVLEDHYPDEAQALVTLMGADTQLFEQDIALSYGTSPRYYAIPIFAYADLDQFMTTFLALSSKAQRSVLKAMNDRYRHSSGLHGELGPERSWIADLRARLLGLKLSRFSEVRMQQLVKWHLDPILGEPS